MQKIYSIMSAFLATAREENGLYTWPETNKFNSHKANKLNELKHIIKIYVKTSLIIELIEQLTPDNKIELVLQVKNDGLMPVSESDNIVAEISKHISSASYAVNNSSKQTDIPLEEIKISAGNPEQSNAGHIFLPELAAKIAKSLMKTSGNNDNLSFLLHQTNEEVLFTHKNFSKIILDTEEQSEIISFVYSVCDYSKIAKLKINQTSYREFSFPENLRNHLIEAQLACTEIIIIIIPKYQIQQGNKQMSGGHIVSISPSSQPSLI